MNNKPENPHAFAFAHSNFNDEWVTSQGMTLRDYFAAKAMQTLLGSEYTSEHGLHEGWTGALAHESYMVADAMLAAREK